MNIGKLQKLLGNITGHLVSESPDRENEIQTLYRSLSRSALLKEIQDLKASHFSFEAADLFSEENISSRRMTFIQDVAERGLAEDSAPELRVFVREVPVRSTQLESSVPLWAGGAAVDHTIGPLVNSDGRLFWFDFFRIEKHVALYVQADPDPVLLFTIRTGVQFLGLNLPLAAQARPVYRLDAGSIWINSKLLAANSPAGYYTGLTVKNGTIALSANPQLINGKLTIPASAKVTVNLQLQQQSLSGAGPNSPYGADARAADIDLPRTLDFHFSALNSTFDKVGLGHGKYTVTQPRSIGIVSNQERTTV